jgi:hypothetical protein
MIIDYTYFVGKINLPQTGNTDGLALVNSFIEDYEPEYLKKVLGYELWKAFSEGIEGSGEPDQRWQDLLEGKEFTYCGKLMKWDGFENRPSPISQYVYYQFIEAEAETTTLVGQASNKTENAYRVNPTTKLVQSWNDMVEANLMLWKFLRTNAADYPEWSISYSNEVYRYINEHSL